MTNGNNTPGLVGGKYLVTGYPVEESHESFCPSHKHRCPPLPPNPTAMGITQPQRLRKEHRSEGQKRSSFCFAVNNGVRRPLSKVLTRSPRL